DRPIAEQLFAQLDRRLRRVRSKTIRTDRMRPVDELLATRTRRDSHDVADIGAVAGAERAARECQRATVRADFRIRRHCRTDPRRAGAITRAERQLVNRTHARNRRIAGRLVARRILDAYLVLDEVADG